MMGKIKRYLTALYWLIKAGRFLSDDKAIERLEICTLCPKSKIDDYGTMWCGVCGCRLEEEVGLARAFSKVYFPKEDCPEGRWPKGN